MRILIGSVIVTVVLTFLIAYFVEKRQGKRNPNVASRWTKPIKPYKLANSHLLSSEDGGALSRRLPVWLNFSTDEPLTLILSFTKGQEFPIIRDDLKKTVDLIIENRELKEKNTSVIPSEDYLIEIDSQGVSMVLTIEEKGIEIQWSVLILDGLSLQRWIDSTYDFIDKQAGSAHVIHDQIDREWKALAESLGKE